MHAGPRNGRLRTFSSFYSSTKNGRFPRVGQVLQNCREIVYSLENRELSVLALALIDCIALLRRLHAGVLEPHVARQRHQRSIGGVRAKVRLFDNSATIGINFYRGGLLYIHELTRNRAT